MGSFLGAIRKGLTYNLTIYVIQSFGSAGETCSCVPEQVNYVITQLTINELPHDFVSFLSLSDVCMYV